MFAYHQKTIFRSESTSRIREVKTCYEGLGVDKKMIEKHTEAIGVHFD